MSKISIEKLREIQVKCYCGRTMTEDCQEGGSVGSFRRLNCEHCRRGLVIEEGILIEE